MSAPTPAPGDDRPRDGYYPDPSIPGYVRYWNGAAWVPGTSRPAPSDGEPLAAPAGVTPAPAPAPTPAPAPASVEETGPIFLDEEPERYSDEPAAPEPATAWQADASRQTGFGGEQDRRVSWGADPRVPAPQQQERADGAVTNRPAQPEPPTPPTDGTVTFRRPTPPTDRPEGTMTMRALSARQVPGQQGPAVQGQQGQGQGQQVPGQQVPGQQGQQAQAQQAQPQQPVAQNPQAPQQPAPPQADGQPRSGPQSQPQPQPQAGFAPQGPVQQPQAQAQQAQAQQAQAHQAHAPQAAPLHPHAPYAPQAPTPVQQPQAGRPGAVPPQAAGAASGTPMTSGPGGGSPSWAQQVHQLAQPQSAQPATGEPAEPEGPVTPWKPVANDPFLAAAQAQASARPAGLGKRLAARLIDSVVLGAVTAVAAVPLGTKAIDHIDGKIDAAKASGREATVWLLDGTTGAYLGIVLAVLLVAGILYEALPTAKWGRTLGKKVCGLQVRDIEEHEAPTFGAALRRWLVYSVTGLLAIGVLGVLWCLFDRPWRQCWHDKAARTFVAG
ncbi:RDD family protein [Streptomyces sp. NBC_01474]|uniref:RDD family protein n=1 Tax=Streptomyces TaxID=1883 RepID=UPI002DDA7C5A|nr:MULTISPECIES: RDD family protein [unclassified Streptomyces]WSD98008.1 RDD family protein [Streptomyces sp. NBC_01474]